MNTVEEFSDFVNSQWQVLKATVSILKLETKLAGLSVFPLLLCLCGLLIIGNTTWLIVVIGLAMLLSQFMASVWVFAWILLGNGLLFFILISYLLFNLRNMSFEKTRQLLAANNDKKTTHPTIEPGAASSVSPTTDSAD